MTSDRAFPPSRPCRDLRLQAYCNVVSRSEPLPLREVEDVPTDWEAELAKECKARGLLLEREYGEDGLAAVVLYRRPAVHKAFCNASGAGAARRAVEWLRGAQ